MNVLRFCELMELAAPGRPPLGTTDSPADEAVRFRSSGRLGFPGHEIEAVETDPDMPGAPPVVRTTFLGLYGVDARMPSYFIDEIAQRRDGAEPLAAFLDLFHHRIVTQFYRVARKYRYPAGFRAGGKDEVSGHLLSLLGLGFGRPTGGQAVSTRKLLSMLGLASQRTRTAEGLAGVLRHAVPDSGVAVEEFHPVWIPVERGASAPLGENCVLGRGFFDRANAVRIVITPSRRESVLGLMPGRAAHGELMALLRFYLGHTAHAFLEMHVPRALMPAPVLNSGDVGLGYTAQLRPSGAEESDEDHTITRVRLGTWRGVAPSGRPAQH
ncbi:type VI secretion system baseplate subunit TssG [Cupriavidus agavae]|nr:type VI secretion system baseplate subunit TssG [Cupriavidus agavae]